MWPNRIGGIVYINFGKFVSTVFKLDFYDTTKRMDSFRKRLPFIVLLMALVSMGEGCSCLWGMHAQTAFCNAGYAIKAEVKNETVETTQSGYVTGRIFKLNVFKVYKGNITGDEAEIRTGGDSAQCGVILQRNKTYFLTGSVWNNVMSVSSCGWWGYFDSLTKSEVLGIEHDFQENCDCKDKIETQLGMTYGRSGPCGYGTDKPYESNCYFRHAYCRKIGPNMCAWETDSSAAPCKKRRKNIITLLKENIY